MKSKNKTLSLFDLQIQNQISHTLLSDRHDIEVEVKYFSNLADIYTAISKKNVEHMALLSTNSEAIDQGFDSIKNLLSEKQSVPLAIFYKKEKIEHLH